MEGEGMRMEPRRTFIDQIYHQLLERIQLGEIESGERLIETQVARSLETSRTPVREAFRRLEQDGIVERLPQGGVRVAPVTMETVDEIFSIRGLLEAFAIEKACESIRSEDILQLQVIKTHAEALIRSKDLDREQKIRRLFKLNTQFHDIIYQSTGSHYLVKIINNLRQIVLRLRGMGLREEKAWKEVWQEHSQLIAFLEKGDKNGAAKLIKRHIEQAAMHSARHSQSDNKVLDRATKTSRGGE